ncbi:MAG: type II secretion system F family protein [Phycisphaerae bacterium]
MLAFSNYALLAQNSQLFVYLLPVMGLMLIFYGVYQVFVESKTTARKKMHSRLRGERTTTVKTSAESILRRGALGESKGFVDAVIGKFKVTPKLQTLPGAFTPKLQGLLDQTDIEWSAAQMIVNLAMAAIIVVVVMLLLSINIVVAAGCGVAVALLPIAALALVRKRRQAKLASQLPDVFEMMSQALRAGHSLAGAIQMIYEQMPPPISREFAQVYHEQNLGVKIEEALQSMAQRVDSLDVKLFVTAVMIQRQTGGDLAEVLDNISGVIRERIELAGLVRGLTAEGRLSGWVLFALPSLVFMATLWMNPDYASVLLKDPRGQVMLLFAGGMQLMGIAMIRWIVNIKV